MGKVEIALCITTDPNAFTLRSKTYDELDGISMEPYNVENGNPLRFKSEPRKVIVIGGEGTNRQVVNYVHGLRRPIPIGLMGGGTNDVFFKRLNQAGFVFSLNEFLQAYPGDQRFCQFRPGEFGNWVFCNDMGLGRFEQVVGRITEQLRGYPDPLRSSLPVLGALASLLIPDNRPVVDIYSVSSHIGPYLAFPDQQVDGKTLVHAWIEGSNHLQRVNKLGEVLTHWKKRLIPPPSLLKVEEGESFDVTASIGGLWIDGDTLQNPHTVKIKRAREPIPIAAIV